MLAAICYAENVPNSELGAAIAAGDSREAA